MSLRGGVLASVLLLAVACSGDGPTAPDAFAPTPSMSVDGDGSVVAGASVVTDKADYAPGETVTVTGAGFWPHEEVDLLLEEDADLHEPRTWTVTADENGGFIDESFSPEEHDIGVAFTLTATGRQSALVGQTTFTDGAVGLFTNLPTPPAPISVPYRRFGSGFAPANTTCTGSPGMTGTVTGVNSASTVLAPSVNTLQSIEFTAPAVAAYAFEGWSVDPSTTIVSTNPVNCFAGVTPTIKYKLNYVPGPTKLAFVTGPFTGQVGECLGPMTVQTQNAASAASASGHNTAVTLSSDNGGTGAGAFYSDASCTTSIPLATVQINAGSTDSPNFYYRATGRGSGTHDLTADDSSPNVLTSATQTQTINKALTTVTYTGDVILLVGGTLHMSAVLTSAYAPCTMSKMIIWGIRPNPLDHDDPSAILGNSTTNSSGVAARNFATTGWIEGIYDGVVNFPGDANCEADKDEAAIAVLAPGNAATGGGFLAGNKVGGGRVNFGFNVRLIEGSDPVAYRGQFLLIKQDGGQPVFRCKGSLDTYGTVPNSDLNAASGTCDFQVWNPTLDGGNGDWEVPAGYGYTDRPFVIQFIDHGSGRGKNAPPPDEFGFSISFAGALADPSFGIASINGGNIDVKSDGGSTTTSTSTGTTNRGGGKKN